MPSVFWIQRQDIGPSPRSAHGMAYDTGRDRVVLFGGDPFGAPLADTWEWDGSLWTQVADTGPSARRGAAMAYSTAGARTILFGGAHGVALRGDTWTFDGADWIQVEDTGPSPRFDHAMAYDQVRDRIVLFGGQTGQSVGDTWEWDGSAWAQVQDTGPSPRYGHVLGYDAASERVVLFGGADANGAGLGDTWTWDGTNWTQAADTGPSPRIAAAVSGGGSVLLFGGLSSLDPALPAADRVVFGDTWRWSAGSWAQVQDMGPRARFGHGMVLRAGASRTVMFGGSTAFGGGAADLAADTWEVPDQAGTPTPNGGAQPGGVQVSYVQVSPQIMGYAPQPLQVTVQLTGPAVAGSQLAIAVYKLVGGNPTLPIPSGYSIPSIVFNGGENGTQFTMVPDGSPMGQGDFAVLAAVGGGQMQGAAFRIGL